MTQYGFYFDGSRCSGCKTCVLSCKDVKNLDAHKAYRQVYDYEGGSWSADGDAMTQDVYAYHVSVSCNHCESPICLANCPQGAISKDEETGAVISDSELCIGCGTCVTSCPYGAPSVDAEQGKSIKCDMCKDRVVEGKKPICVEACPLRALDFGEIDELRATYGSQDSVPPLPAATTGPCLVIKEAPAMAVAKTSEGFIANEPELV